MSEDKKIISIIGFITVALIAGAMIFLGKPSNSATSNTSPKVDTNILVRDDSFKIASDSAKVTVVEFADFECPACAAVHPNVTQVLKDYNGKITYVFRHFPLPQHKNARKAAEAAEAAGEQGKFWEMYNKLFETQNDWADLANPTDKFVSYAQELGLDKDKFKQIVDSDKFESKIQRDWTDGVASNINATPTFFINGVKMAGEPTVANFKSQIDPLLK